MNQYGVPAYIDGKRNPAYGAARYRARRDVERVSRVARSAAYHAAHGAEDRAYRADYYAANRDKILAYAKAHPPSTEQRAWKNAIQRTTNPNHKNWQDYGGRGIQMCEAWLHDFAAFLAHIGPKPDPSLTLDRINNDGHYEPGNVRWATWSEQRSNRLRAQ